MAIRARPVRSGPQGRATSGSWRPRIQPLAAIPAPTATRTLSTADRVRSRQARAAGSRSVPAPGSAIGPGLGGGDLAAEAEDQLDLADRLAGLPRDRLGRHPGVG